MKIGVAQIQAIKGDIEANIETHKKWIQIAISKNADLIVFPELSLTAYEPQIAKTLATNPNDSRLNEFQQISDLNHISIGIGLPTQSENGILISMLIFQPHRKRQVYSKQLLHSDELPFFINGNKQLILTVKNKKIAPAICYESLQKQHAENVKTLGAEIYLASVAKSEKGVKKAFSHYPEIAKKFSMPILMSNSVGDCDNFLSAGQSSVWNKNGELLYSLEHDKEGLLIFNTETENIIRY